jgi:hypothetical protein
MLLIECITTLHRAPTPLSAGGWCRNIGLMHVAYIGNFDPWWSTETHIGKALENLGHEVSRIPEQRTDWARLEVEADLCLWTRTAGFDPPDLGVQAEAIRRIGCPVVGYHLDRWWGLDREVDIDRSPWFTETDLLCTADGGHQEAWASKGITHYWFPPAILSDEAHPGTPIGDWDVGFVGNLTGYGHREWASYRLGLFNFLRDRYRNRFAVFPKPQQKQIRGTALADVYASVKVLIGDSCLAGDATYYWSDRIPETTGRGGFLIHPQVEGLFDVHPRLVTYPLGDFEQLGRQIDRALTQENYRVANAAQNRAHTVAHHTYEQRMSRLFAIM